MITTTIENDILDLTCRKHSRWPPYGIHGNILQFLYS